MTPLEFGFLAAAAVAAAYLLAVAVAMALGPVRRAAGHAGRSLGRPFQQAADRDDVEDRNAAIDRELDAALGLGSDDGAEEDDVVSAAIAAQTITILHKTLKDAACGCLAAHWAIVKGLGSTDMAEAARHSYARRRRQRVVDLSHVLADRLGQYPLLDRAPDLLTLHFGVRRLGVMCITCPYFSTSVHNAPLICPTVQALAHEAPSKTRHEPADGVVIDASFEEER